MILDFMVWMFMKWMLIIIIMLMWMVMMLIEVNRINVTSSTYGRHNGKDDDVGVDEDNDFRC